MMRRLITAIALFSLAICTVFVLWRYRSQSTMDVVTCGQAELRGSDGKVLLLHPKSNPSSECLAVRSTPAGVKDASTTDWPKPWPNFAFRNEPVGKTGATRLAMVVPMWLAALVFAMPAVAWAGHLRKNKGKKKPQ